MRSRSSFVSSSSGLDSHSLSSSHRSHSLTMLQTAGLNSDKSLENELGSPGKSSILPGEDLSQRGVTWFLWRVLVVIIAFTVILWAISIFHTEQKHDLNIETNSMQGKGCSLIAKGRVSDRNTSIDVVDVFLLKTHLAGIIVWFQTSP